jgi:hypothetical protein
VDSQVTENAPPVLQNLISAGLVSHEMVGDPARLDGEAACLRALCALVGGSVYRLDPFHYAFNACADGQGGTLGDIEADARADSLETALSDALGRDAVRIKALPGMTQDQAGQAGFDAPVLHLKALEDAVAGIAPPEAGLQAVISARFAVETARLAAGEAPGSALNARLAAIEDRLERITGTLERPAAPVADPALARTLVSVLARLEKQQTCLEGLAGDVAAKDAGMAGFQDSIGLALAEFLARLERHAGQTAAVPAKNPAADGVSAPMAALGS